MPFPGTHKPLHIFSLLCIFVFPAFAEAKDISSLQTAAALAREDMEKEKGKHDASTQVVARQQLVVAERKKQLDEENRQLDKMQKEAKQALERYLEAKKKYEEAQSTLDTAWGKK